MLQQMLNANDIYQIVLETNKIPDPELKSRCLHSIERCQLTNEFEKNLTLLADYSKFHPEIVNIVNFFTNDGYSLIEYIVELAKIQSSSKGSLPMSSSFFDKKYNYILRNFLCFTRLILEGADIFAYKFYKDKITAKILYGDLDTANEYSKFPYPTPICEIQDLNIEKIFSSSEQFEDDSKSTTKISCTYENMLIEIYDELTLDFAEEFEAWYKVLINYNNSVFKCTVLGKDILSDIPFENPFIRLSHSLYRAIGNDKYRIYYKGRQLKL